jgi:hypothetical protein
MRAIASERCDCACRKMKGQWLTEPGAVMSTAQEVNGWLTDIGRRLGHDLSLDDDGRCGFSFGEGLVGVVAVPPGSDEVLFHATIATFPSIERPTLERILALNLYGTATDGATLGLDAETGEVVLARRWPWEMVGSGRFDTLLGNFLATATRLHKSLAAPAAAATVYSTRDELLANIAWRA